MTDPSIAAYRFTALLLNGFILLPLGLFGVSPAPAIPILNPDPSPPGVLGAGLTNRAAAPFGPIPPCPTPPCPTPPPIPDPPPAGAPN